MTFSCVMNVMKAVKAMKAMNVMKVMKAHGMSSHSTGPPIQLVPQFNWSPNTGQFVDEGSFFKLDCIKANSFAKCVCTVRKMFKTRPSVLERFV